MRKLSSLKKLNTSGGRLGNVKGSRERTGGLKRGSSSRRTIQEEVQYEHEEDFETGFFEFQMQKVRIKKILETAIYKLRILTQLPAVLENEGEILHRFLNKTEADFVYMVCQEGGDSRTSLEPNRSDLELIFNMLERITIFERRGSSSLRKGRIYYSGEAFDTSVAYAVDLIFKCEPLVKYMESLEEEPDSLMLAFIDSMIQLEKIVAERLSISAVEEVQRENDLKTAYRLSMMLSNNIEELEDFLEKQRQELGREHDRKEAILYELEEKIDKLREKCRTDINKIIYESEVSMMRDYNKSIERQEELAREAADSTKEFEALLQNHLEREKIMRAKRLKVEAQLASWVAKYDTDIGEKQSEYDELEKTYKQEKEEMELLQEQFDEQEEEYLALMREKEEEEQRIYEEKAWIFLQNRSARRIQRYWRAYRARKLARKKGKKGKKGTGKKGKKSPKAPKEEELTLREGPDPNLLLQKHFSEVVLSEIKSKEAFDKTDVSVNLFED